MGATLWPPLHYCVNIKNSKIPYYVVFFILVTFSLLGPNILLRLMLSSCALFELLGCCNRGRLHFHRRPDLPQNSGMGLTLLTSLSEAGEQTGMTSLAPHCKRVCVLAPVTVSVCQYYMNMQMLTKSMHHTMSMCYYQKCIQLASDFSIHEYKTFTKHKQKRLSIWPGVVCSVEPVKYFASLLIYIPPFCTCFV